MIVQSCENHLWTWLCAQERLEAHYCVNYQCIVALRTFFIVIEEPVPKPQKNKNKTKTLISSAQMYEDVCSVQSVCVVTPIFFFSFFSETARTRGYTEDGCHPGKETPRRGPQRLVFPRQAPGGSAGARRLRGQRPSRQHLQTEHPGQGQVSRGNTCTCPRWSSYCRLQEMVEHNSVVSDNVQRYFQECSLLWYFISLSRRWSFC